VGSSGVVMFELKDGKSFLLKEARVEFIDDGPGKLMGISRFIGHGPIMAFGNSDGDQQMLEYTGVGNGTRLMMLVLHATQIASMHTVPPTGCPTPRSAHSARHCTTRRRWMDGR
jgi:hypothetical protein